MEPQHGLEEFVELAHFELDPESIRRLSREFCQRHAVVVLGCLSDEPGDEPVPIGMLRPFDTAVLDNVSGALHRPVRPVRLHLHEIERAIAVGYPEPGAARERGRIELRPVARVSYRPDREARDLVHEALAQAITLGASDVHFECYEDDVDVRLRIDGVLRQINTPFAPDHVPAAVSYLKVLSGLDIAERRRAQDGRVLTTFVDHQGESREIELRLSVLPGPHGEDAVLRILDSAAAEVGFDELGFDPATAERFAEIVASPEGLVLVCGPTGSGKTTTLYAALRRVNHDGNKLLTVENPIEYRLPKANQKQVGPAMGFADYARSFLRQDPDVLMIGEIRDEETAGLAVRAAQTGHLVLSTLHTRDSVGAVPRLGTLGLDGGMIADALLGVLAQRLVRRICDRCREPADPDPRLLERLGRSDLEEPVSVGRGCNACRGDGYRGRVGVFELLVVDGELAHRIAAGEPPHRLRQAARERGLRTLLDDALDKVRAGKTTLSEVARHVPYALYKDSGRER
ncbi:MAG TPA: GspE/PulE family protein [Thermoanaerobaculia bacterium]|nr:GspE/PulE family protein [Thermoanaerobaculia bacterium]